MKQTIQQRVMHWAHIMHRQGVSNWSTALGAAWAIHHLRRYLTRGVVRFTFTKQSGEQREARGTLCPELIPPSKTPKGIVQTEVEQGLRKPDYADIAYYDLDREAWRAFSICNVTTISDIRILC